jgi:hypothetical protein
MNLISNEKQVIKEAEVIKDLFRYVEVITKSNNLLRLEHNKNRNDINLLDNADIIYRNSLLSINWKKGKTSNYLVICVSPDKDNRASILENKHYKYLFTETNWSLCNDTLDIDQKDKNNYDSKELIDHWINKLVRIGEAWNKNN